MTMQLTIPIKILISLLNTHRRIINPAEAQEEAENTQAGTRMQIQSMLRNPKDWMTIRLPGLEEKEENQRTWGKAAALLHQS